MRENGKFSLLHWAYYGTIILMLGMVASLFVVLITNDVAMWVRVTYLIIASLLVLTVVLDIISTYANTNRYIVGFMLLVLSVATAIVSFVLYARLSATGGVVPMDNFNYFLSEAGNLVLIDLLAIAIYVMGQYLTRPQTTTIRANRLNAK